MAKRINSRAKGAAGEREFCQWLSDNLNIDKKPERNLLQVREGGADITDVEPFMFEVKRVENLDLHKAWSQVVIACYDLAKKNDTFVNEEFFDMTGGKIPVVAYRTNKSKWEFLIPAQFIELNAGYITLKESVFIRWANARLIEC